MPEHIAAPVGGLEPLLSLASAPETLIVPIPAPSLELQELEQEWDGPAIDVPYINRFLTLYCKDAVDHIQKLQQNLERYVCTTQPRLLADIYAAEMERRRRFDVFYSLFCALYELSKYQRHGFGAWRVRSIGPDYLVLGIPDVRGDHVR